LIGRDVIVVKFFGEALGRELLWFLGGGLAELSGKLAEVSKELSSLLSLLFCFAFNKQNLPSSLSKVL
jgi:hypothetical protein